MSSLRIYGIARTRAFRALWMAKELGLDYEHDPVEIGDAGARTPEFLAINPNGRLPVIVDDGFVLFESLAITLYLAKKHSLGRLYPGTLEGEARAWQWGLWALTEVDRGVNIWSLHAVRLPPQEQDLAKRAEALKVLVAPFKVLDAAVAAQPYLLGSEFTVADLNVAAVISRAIEMDLRAVPNLKAWLTRLAWGPSSVPKSASPTMRNVSCIISDIIPTGSPRAARGSQLSSIREAARTIRPAMAAMRWRWNAGWASRRCRSQNVPWLVSSPLPTTQRAVI